jgi:hypothetical protein
MYVFLGMPGSDRSGAEPSQAASSPSLCFIDFFTTLINSGFQELISVVHSISVLQDNHQWQDKLVSRMR